MKKQFLWLTNSLLLVMVLFSSASAQLKKTYYINSLSQLTRSDNYNGCGTHYTDWYEQYFGFKWTDNLPQGTTITDLKIEVNIGQTYWDFEINSMLNDVSQGYINGNSMFYDCYDRTNILTPATIHAGDYVKGGLNVFKFNSDWGSISLCKTPALNNSFAKVTVTYLPVYSGGPTPTITSLNTNSGKPCSNVTIYGTNFNNSLNYVQFNDALATSFTVVSNTELIATIPPDATNGPIRVYTNGGMAASDNDFTVVTPPTPEITGISALSGSVDQPLTITGTNLSCATAVTIGGTAVKSYTVISDTEITAIVGYGSSGAVAVTTPGGTGSFGNFTYYTPTVASQMNIGGSSEISNTNANVSVVVDPTITIGSNGSIKDFTISISDGYTDGDMLNYNGDLPAGITTSGFNSNTGVIVFEGAILATDWQEFLRRVTFQSTSNLCFPKRRKISFTAGKKFYNPLTQHYYEYASNGVSWSDAKADAANRSYFGRQGYLATITSKAENNFIWKIMSADAWIGGTDNYLEINEAAGTTLYANQAESEGKYYWVTGPEKGQQFSSQNAYEAGGVLNVGSQYQNWSNGEPNDWPGMDNSSAGEEDYAQIYSSGIATWNDLPKDYNLTYIIEYGDMPNDNTANQVVFTKELNVYGSSAGTITGGNVSVCAGNNSTTLTLTNMTGSVVRWESSNDNFLTPGDMIDNTTTTLQVDNISKTTYYRVVVNSTSPATCSELAGSSVVVTAAETVSGSVTAINNTICEGAPAELTLFGNQGDVLSWQMASDAGFTSPINFMNTTNSLQHTLSVAGTYYFRAQVQKNQCGTPVWSEGKSITVNSGTPPVGGEVSSDEHLATTLSGTLKLTGYNGDITKWQYSTDNGLVWIDISNTSKSYMYNQTPGTTTMYRAVVSQSGCGTTFSNAGTVRIYGNNQYVWKGTISRESNNADNWLDISIPGTYADVVISNHAQNPIELNQHFELGNIDFNASNRKIILGNYNLSVSSITGADADNFIQTTGSGNVRKTISHGSSFSFPVGNTTYNPVVITNNTGSSDEFRVKVRNEVLQGGTTGNSISSSYVQRTWDIDKGNPTANSGAGINFTFNWNNGDIIGTLTNPSLYHFGTSWEMQTGMTSSTVNSLSYTGYTGTFSPFAIVDLSSALPVSLLDFSVKRQQNTAVLNWQTASEQNSKDFVIQRSSGNGRWQNIGMVIAAGNSDIVRSYHFTDMKPEAGNNFYRLLQRDVNGKENLSKTLSLQFNAPVAQVNVYPTLISNGMVHVKLVSSGSIFIYNASGNLVYAQKGTSGINTLSTSQLSRGVYYVRAANETTKIIIQ